MMEPHADTYQFATHSKKFITVGQYFAQSQFATVCLKYLETYKLAHTATLKATRHI